MQDGPVRLDKWLWAARFFKTRGLAKDAIEGGKVHVDGARARPSRNVMPGMIIRMRLGQDEKTVEVLALSSKRGPAKVAQTLYEETPDSREKREKEAVLRREARLVTAAAPTRRPDKKARRDLRRVKHQNPEG